MAELLIRFLARVRPREGWGRFLLALAAVLCLPATLISARGVRAGVSGASLVAVVLLAMALAVRLARSRAAWQITAVLGTLLGAATAAIVVGRLVPPVSLLWREGLALFTWLRDLPRSAGQGLPLAELRASVGGQLHLLTTRLWWAGQDPAGGQAADPILGELLVVLLAWGCTFFAGWQMVRRQRALLGLLPAGAMLAVVAFFQGGMPVFYLFSLIFFGLWLAALQRLRGEQEGWDAAGTDYPDGLSVEMSMMLLPWLVAVLGLAAISPVVRINSVRQAFWQRMDEPWSRLEAAAERYVGPIDAGGALSAPASAGARGELPRSHLLGAGPELNEIEVLRVSTSDPAPEVDQDGQPAQGTPRRYWRRSTFDTYTGQGWINVSQEAQDLAAGAPLAAGVPPRGELWQRFEVVETAENWLYAANAPYRFDVAVQAWRRASGELVGVTGDARRYTVLSYPPALPLAGTQAREGSTPGAAPLPAEVAALYLALPEGVPQRVLELARQVAGTAPGRYEQAGRIEAYLRRYAYSLQLPEPPANRDLVDWFLFDLQEGYCDYYASAMVVLARAAGLPARLATGYAQGTYDPESGAWIVNAMDAHSWPEIYIDGAGWVEFEPTAGQPALERPGEAPPADVPLPPPGAGHWLRHVPWGLVALGALAVALLAAIAWLWRPATQAAAEPAALVRDRYRRLLRWGQRLGHPLHGGQTALEYGRDLGRDLCERGQAGALAQAREASARAPAEIEQLAAALNEAQYGREPVAEHTGWRVRALWSRLRGWLLWLWIAGRRRRPG